MGKKKNNVEVLEKKEALNKNQIIDDNINTKATDNDGKNSNENTAQVEEVNNENKDVLEEENTESKNIEEQDTSKEYKVVSNPEKKNKIKKVLLIFFIVFIIATLMLTLSTIFAIINLNNNKIINGIFIANKDVSNLIIVEAKEQVSNLLNEKVLKDFTLYYEDYEIKVSPTQFEASFDADESVEKAYSIGRSDNFFKNNFDILNALLKTCNITPTFKYNEAAINSLISEMQANIPDHLVEPSYYIEGTNLIITNGEDGIVIRKDLLKERILNYINDFNLPNDRIEIPVLDKKASSINIDKIYSEVCKEPQDAYYTKEPYAVYPHVNGINFAISIEEAKKLLEEEKDTYTIPIKLISPKVTTKDLAVEAFPNLLATFATNFSTSNVNRSTNIRLATQKINGIVIMPGETFSYNQTVGKRTAAAGFKEAAVYSGGRVTTGIGGGICQVSSTLYNAVLLANLEIVERENHLFNPGYVKAGTDATVSWGGPDFKFKNTRNYPIKVQCSTNNGTVLFNLYGLKEENEYEVSIEATITSYIPYKTETQKDSNLEEGQTKVIESGSSGCNSVTYRVLKSNGKEVSRQLISKDTYSPHNRVIAVGTKVVTPAAQVVDQPTNEVNEETEVSQPIENNEVGE